MICHELLGMNKGFREILLASRQNRRSNNHKGLHSKNKSALKSTKKSRPQLEQAKLETAQVCEAVATKGANFPYLRIWKAVSFQGAYLFVWCDIKNMYTVILYDMKWYSLYHGIPIHCYLKRVYDMRLYEYEICCIHVVIFDWYRSK